MTAAAAHEGRDYDVAVVGGGPAGAAVATRLAQGGRRVLVLEREVFPRFHIGESQLPWSDEALRALGVDAAVAGAGFVEKWGASFMTADGATEQYADFASAVETPRPQTYQVPRAEFDRLLLAHAAESGAEVRLGARAVDVAFDAAGATVVYTYDETRAEARVSAVVDASGRSGFLARRHTERRYDPLLRNVAVHAQYEGVARRSGRRAGDIQLVTRPDRGWFWFIPLSPTVTSVGIVLPKDVYGRTAATTLEESLGHYLGETPGAARLVAGARRVSPARFDADYSYESSRYAGDRWLLVGDAGAFLDPIFSTGVLLALQSGLEAAAVLDAALAAGDLSYRRLAGYERLIRRRYHHFRRFAVGFYDPAFRDLWFQPAGRLRIREAVLSVLAGNWRPSLPTRVRIGLFFALVALHRWIPIAPRLHEQDGLVRAPASLAR